MKEQDIGKNGKMRISYQLCNRRALQHDINMYTKSQQFFSALSQCSQKTKKRNAQDVEKLQYELQSNQHQQQQTNQLNFQRQYDQFWQNQYINHLRQQKDQQNIPQYHKNQEKSQFRDKEEMGCDYLQCFEKGQKARSSQLSRDSQQCCNSDQSDCIIRYSEEEDSSQSQDLQIFRQNPNFYNYLGTLPTEVRDHQGYELNLGMAQSEISKLQVSKYQDHNQRQQEKCAICITQMQNEDIIMKLKCSHFYHQQCVIKWLLINIRCPICKGLQVSREANK